MTIFVIGKDWQLTNDGLVCLTVTNHCGHPGAYHVTVSRTQMVVVPIIGPSCFVANVRRGGL